MILNTLSKISGLTLSLAMITSLGFASIATAQATTTNNSGTNEQAHLKTIITKGNAEITRRQSVLASLSSKINSSVKLSSVDKSSLSSEVSTENSGLASLKTKLDSETTLSAATADAQSIVNDYRVYALVVPKVSLVKFADDQQVAEAKLSALATKLQTRLSNSSSPSLQAALNDMTAKVVASQAISSSLESKVINLLPSDYNSDHTLLNGDLAQLKSAQADNQAAHSDAQSIIAGLQKS